MNTLPINNWHHLPIEDALAALESSPQAGLTDSEVHHRQGRFGLNVLAPKRGKSPLTRFLLQFHNALI